LEIFYPIYVKKSSLKEEITMNVRKILKEISIFVIMALIVTNLISYFKQPKLDFKEFPKLQAKLVDGNNFSYKDLNNTPFILHFWATWCPVCKVEISNFEKLKDDGYEVITVAVSSGSDQKIKDFLKKRDLSFKVINDQNAKLAKYFKVQGFPTTFIFNKDKKLIYTDVGYTSDLSIKFKIWLFGR